MSAQQQLLDKYGEPNHDYILAWCSEWEVKNEFPWFPVNSFLVNRDFEAILRKAFTALQAAGLHTEIKTYDGCYNERTVRGSTAISLHSWACAIDLNASEEGMESIAPDQITPEKRLGNWSKEFVDTMKSAGLYYGGDFHSIHADGTERLDPMHYALLDG
jgi:D-alanyl-D-alanine carboxypeptidase